MADDAPVADRRSPPTLRLIALLIGVPILMLWAVDRAIVLYGPHWEWVVREIPPDELDPYRLEAIVRTTEPGRQNVPILGDSTARAALSPRALDAAFADRGLTFSHMVIDGTATVSFGLLTPTLLELDPGAAILFVSTYTLRTRGFYETVYNYDVRAVPALFTLDEVLSHPDFHLRGAVGQLHVLFRHRRALQASLGVYMGWRTIGQTRAEQIRALVRALRSGEFGPVGDWLRAARVPETYPNPNTRAIDLLARRMAARGGTLVVIESPVNPQMAFMVPGPKLEEARAHVRAITERHGATYLAGADLPALQPDDFIDHTHLSEQGRTTFTAGIAARLREIL